MATAIVFKSESADYYLYAVDSDKVKSVPELKELLIQEWYIVDNEVSCYEGLTTDLDYEEVREMLQELIYS